MHTLGAVVGDSGAFRPQEFSHDCPSFATEMDLRATSERTCWGGLFVSKAYAGVDPGRNESLGSTRDALAVALLSAVDPQGPLEEVFLFRATGAPLASWSRHASPPEIVTTMAATLWGSVTTLIEAVGGPSPSCAWTEAGDRILFVCKVPPQGVLLLIAPKSVDRVRFNEEAERLRSALSDTRASTPADRVALRASK